MKLIGYLFVAAAALALGCGDGDSKPASDGSGIDDASIIDAGAQPDALQAACVPVPGTNLGLEEVASGLERPLFVTSPPGDARLFIVEQVGRIVIVEDGARVPQPFLDLTEMITDLENEQGLLGLAFHPDYATNGRFFVNYTAASPRGDTVVAEYRVSADRNVADTTEERLLVVDQPFSNHNGGMIAFGPDGYLYIGMGDGGSGGDPRDHGENITTLLGSLLRIDVDNGDPYGIPPTNPYADSPNGENDPRPEIWAYGLRNPWRFSFDRTTGDLYIADVGQIEWEEVNVQPAASSGGENYGWDIMEGAHCYEPAANCDMTGKILPVTEYAHEGAGCTGSITGGYVYRGTCMPDVQGRYFYADYCFDRMWTFTYASGQATDEQELAMPLALDVSSFGEDATGELYVVSLDGVVYRIVAGR